MPNQSKLIKIVNNRLRQLDFDFQFDKDGICAGLASLYVKHALEDNTEEFFQQLEKLSQLPLDYEFGKNQYAENFIREIETAFNPARYNQQYIDRFDLEKIHTINGDAISNEFNLGLITEEANWESILSQIARNNRAWYLLSTNHAIAIAIKNGNYIIYDPNYRVNTKAFQNAADVIAEIKKCFSYDTDPFALSIRVFANPKDKVCNDYPDPLTFQSQARPEFETKNKPYRASTAATKARDKATLAHLLKNNDVQLDAMTGIDYINPHMIDLLLEQPKSEQIKIALLMTIRQNIFWNNTTTVERLLTHYKAHYKESRSTEDLTLFLVSSFECLADLVISSQSHTMSPLNKMNKQGDYHYLLNLCDYNLIKANAKANSNYTYLKLVTLYSASGRDELNAFLETISEEEIITQIRFAAQFNHTNLLQLLLKKAPKTTVSLMTKELIQHITVNNLNLLIAHGITLNPELLSECLQCKDKIIFDRYKHAVLLQTKQTKTQQEPLFLKQKTGDVTELESLVYLDGLDAIKLSWDDKIDALTIQSALSQAVDWGKEEISFFLHSKACELTQDIVNPWIEKAIDEKNFASLVILAKLNYNVLLNLKNAKIIFNLSNTMNDHTIFEHAFDKADSSIQNVLLRASMDYQCTPIFNLCLKNDSLHLSALIELWVLRSSWKTDRNIARYLSYINDHLEASAWHEMQILIDGWADLPEYKGFVQFCFQNDLHIVENLASSITWTDDELSALFEMAIVDNKPHALQYLLDNHPRNQLPLNQLKIAIDNGNEAVLQHLSEREHNYGLDFKTLFMHSLEKGNPAIAELLIKKPLHLNPQDTLIIQKHFDNNTLSFDALYQKGHGQLYVFLMDLGCKNLSHPFESDINLSMIERAINENNAFLVNAFCTQFKNQKLPISKMLARLENNLNGSVLDVFEKQYGWETVLTLALKERAFTTVAFILERHTLNTNSDYLKTLIQSNKEEIIRKFISELYKQCNELIQTENYSALKKIKIKERLFNLIDPSTTNNELTNLLNTSESTHPMLISTLEKAMAASKVKLPDTLNTKLKNMLYKTITTIEENLIAIMHKGSFDYAALVLFNLTERDQEAKKQLKTQLLLPETLSVELIKSALIKQLASNPTEEAIADFLKPYEVNDAYQNKKAMAKKISDIMDFNKTIYRYQLDNASFNTTLEELSGLIEDARLYVEKYDINLVHKIEDEKLIALFSHIKNLMASQEIHFYYLKREYEPFVQLLLTNPRFKIPCQIEMKLHSLLKQYPMTNLSNAQQVQLKKIGNALTQALIDSNLSSNFVETALQAHIGQKATQVKEIRDVFTSTARNVCDQLGITFTYSHKKNQPWVLISDLLKETIKVELEETLLDLLPTLTGLQKDIIVKNISLFQHQLTGTCTAVEPLDTLLNNIKTNGLTGLYYDFLQYNLKQNQLIPELTTYLSGETIPARFDNLKENTKHRETAIRLFVFKIIAQVANLEELQELVSESHEKNLEGIKKLRKNHSISFFTTSSSTPSHVDTEAYENYCAFLDEKVAEKQQSKQSGLF